MENKKILRSTLIGFVFLLLALLVTGAIGISDLMNGGTGTLYGHEFTYGLRATIGNYFLLWRPSQFVHETAYIGLVLVLVGIFSALFLIIGAIAKKKPICILPALFFGASVAYLPFIFMLVIPMIQLGVMRAIPQLLMAGATGLTLFAIFFEFLALRALFGDIVNKLGGKEKAPAGEGLSEEEVKKIVEDYLDKHVEELHPRAVVEQPVEEPAEEEPQEEEPAEEPAPVEEPKEEEPEEEPVDDEEEEEEEEEEESSEAPADDGAPVGPASKGKRRRANFETRLKNSEFDLRHKYYDLRDYIKWYGLRNRISIPGDTFSYKRQRYVFVTIVGKHIRVYLGLDPNDYADSTIPVEQAQAKKYEDLPCLLRVKSDLSYRRAKKLVDDLMQKVGLEKPDEDEPKETQKQE